MREVAEESLREKNRKGQVGFYTCRFLDLFSFLGAGDLSCPSAPNTM